ncbi:MAG: hypothetical protein F6K49_47010 [Moorea sp. SIO3I6]|nr:hypothetical protein [Moorena sp. SIO3I6]
MTNNPGGFSVSGSVGGDIHNLQQGDNSKANQGDNNQQGDNNTQVIQGQGAASAQEQLTKEQVIELLAKLDKLVQGNRIELGINCT